MSKLEVKVHGHVDAEGVWYYIAHRRKGSNERWRHIGPIDKYVISALVYPPEREPKYKEDYEGRVIELDIPSLEVTHEGGVRATVENLQEIPKGCSICTTPVACHDLGCIEDCPVGSVHNG